MTNKDRLRDALVNSIIGDIPSVFTFDDDIGIEPVSDEEVAEIEAGAEEYWDQLSAEDKARMKADGKDFGMFAAYHFGMMRLGLSPVDYYEWSNMNPRPTVPEETK